MEGLSPKLTVSSVLPTRSCDDVRAELEIQRICFMVEEDVKAINMVDREGFCELEVY